MNRVDGKVAIVTGGGAGVGEAACELLASAGAKVVVTDINAETAVATVQRIHKAGGEALALKHNVASEADWKAVVDRCLGAYGQWDVLVNNAATSPLGACKDTELDEWRRSLAVNLDGTFLGVRFAINAMKDTSTNGSIINICSIAALAGDCQTTYSAAKGGVRYLSKSAAVECGKKGYGIRINTICPGPLDTAMSDGIRETPGWNQLKKLLAVGRFGRPLDIARGILFLASEDSSFITGTDLVIDGGITATNGGILMDYDSES